MSPADNEAEDIPIDDVLLQVRLNFLNGVLANGGGLVLVPFYQLAVGLDLRSALASSLASVALLAVPEILVHNSLGHIDGAPPSGWRWGCSPVRCWGADRRCDFPHPC